MARRPLDGPALETALAELIGKRVSVRVVERSEKRRLVAVLEGVLCEPTDEKAPSRFWPLSDGLDARPAAAERFGIVLHPDAVAAVERVPHHVFEITQAGVTLNLRAL